MTNHTLQKKIFKSGVGLVGLAVALGAVGAHQLKDMIDAPSMLIFEKAVRYQMIHGLAMIAMASMLRKLNEEIAQNAWSLFMAGTVVFCGSLFLLSTRSLTLGNSIRWIGGLTPIGGICFIAGWWMLWQKGYKMTNHAEQSRAKKFYEKTMNQPEQD